MRQEKANYSIKRMARLLKVSRSCYYKWSHTQDQRAAGNDEREAYMAEVDRKIRQIFNDSGCVYGSPRVTAELACRYQITLNRKTVAKRMRLMGVEGISPRMFAPVKPLDSQRTSSIPDLSHTCLMQVSSIACRFRISPTCALVKAGCICASYEC